MTAEVGPTDVRLSLRPSLVGDVVVDVAPLGTLGLDSHDGPLQLAATVQRVRPEEVQRIIQDPQLLNGLGDEVDEDLREALLNLVMRATMSAVGGAALLGLVVFRTPARAGWSVLTCCVVMLGSVTAGVGTFNPRSLAEPRYTGLLASAPSVVGSAESVVQNFSRYTDQLADVVTNVSRVYETTSTLPAYEADSSTVRLLHVSDLHLNPAAWQVIDSVSRQFQADVIVDTGDITDHGSKTENRFLTEISDLDTPYVFVRGNHDSMGTQEALAKQKGAIVLDENAGENGSDGQVAEVAGLRFFGIGDPRFTPDKRTREHPSAEALFAEGQQLAQDIGAQDPPIDVAAVHDPTEGRGFDGTVPLVLSGHAHRRSTQILPRGTRLFVQGSTGGAGLRGLEHEEPTPVECTVFYFNKETGRLQAWDDITVGGIGLASARIERHLEPAPDRKIGLPASPSSSPSGTSSPAGTSP
ncbi:MAG: hypothetical protein GEV03_05725 [Streptosporangiales bacterium]|nr:hypothetical protein [Streptosporangiales bacterium]